MSRKFLLQYGPGCIVCLAHLFFSVVPRVAVADPDLSKHLLSPRELQVKTDAQTFAKYCTNKNSNIIESTPIKGQIGFFVKPMMLNQKLHYTVVSDGKPTLIDTNGNEVAKLPGDQDPLVSFDNELFTVLHGNNGRFAVKFYDPRSLSQGKPKELPSNLDITGAYQSIAPIKSPNGEKTYRMILDRAQMTNTLIGGKIVSEVEMTPVFMDFKRTKDGIVNLQADYTEPCKGKRLQTPFISKRGTRMAALNLETQTTQIFDISGGGCKLQTDLGFATGKADFSYDDNKIAFHLAAKPMQDSQGWVKDLGRENSSNIFTYDITTKKINQITQNQNSKSYYPAFLPDGSIMHIDSKDRNEPGWKSDYSIGRSKDAHLATGPQIEPVCTDKPEVLRSRFAIGQLLHGICTNIPEYQNSKSVHSTYLVVKANEISPAECRNLVKKYWTAELQKDLLEKGGVDFADQLKQEDILKLKQTDILAGCDVQ